MFCPECRNQIDDDSTYCPVCGKKISDGGSGAFIPSDYSGDGFAPVGELKGSLGHAGKRMPEENRDHRKYVDEADDYQKAYDDATDDDQGEYDDEAGDYQREYDDVKIAEVIKNRFKKKLKKKNINKLWNPDGMGGILKTRKKLLIKGGVAIALVVVLVTAVVMIRETLSYERPVKELMKILNTKDVSKVTKAAVSAMPVDLLKDIEIDDEYSDLLEDYYDNAEDIIEQAQDMMEDAMEDMWDEIEDTYGDDAKITYKIREADNLKNSELKELRSQYENTFGVDGDRIEDAMTMEVKIRIEGSDGKDSEKTTITVIKVGWKWYIDILNSKFF